MTDLENFNKLIELEKSRSKIKLITKQGDVYYCEIHCPSEGDDELAYIFVSPDYPTKYFILDCDFIDTIEEINDDEWKRHLGQIAQQKNRPNFSSGCST